VDDRRQPCRRVAATAEALLTAARNANMIITGDFRIRARTDAECTAALTAVARRQGQKTGNYKHGRYVKEVAAAPMATRGYSYAPRPE
jgi:hypothetical protein